MLNALKKVIKNWTLSDDEALAIFGSTPTASGVVVTETTAMQQATVFACVRILSDIFSSIPLNIHERLSDGSTRVAHDFSIHKLLQKPNDLMTPTDFKKASMVSLLLAGERYAEIIRNKKQEITKIIPISANLVNKDEEALKIGKLVYRVASSVDGKERLIQSKNMWRSIGLTKDGVNGLSPISMQRETIGHAIKASEHGAKLLSKGGTPSVVIKGNVKDPAQRKIMGEEWDTRYGGGGGSAVVPLDWQVEPLRISNEDMQYLDSRKFQRSEIATGIFGVPLHFVGDMDKATLNNVEQQSLEFIKYGLNPYLISFEESITRDLLTEEQRKIYYPKFNLNGLLRGDTETRANFYDKMTKIGVMSINDIRELEDMNRIKDGDGHFRQLNEIDITKPQEKDKQDGKN